MDSDGWMLEVGKKESKPCPSSPCLLKSFICIFGLKRKQMKPKMSFVKSFVKRLGISKRLTFVYILLGIQTIKMRQVLKDH